MFYLDTNSQVIQRVVTDGVPGPEHNLGAVLHPGSTIAATWRADGTRLELFGRGTENALWQKSFTWTQGWGPWTARTAAGTLTSSPTAVSTTHPTTGKRQADVFFRGNDGLLTRLTSSSGTWSAPQALPFAEVGTAPSAFVSDAQLGKVDVYAGCNGALCRWTYDTDRGTVHIWGPIAGTSVAAPPTAASSSPGQVQVAVRDHNDHLILWQNRGSAWTQTDTGPAAVAAGSSIAMAPMSPTNTILYARGAQGSLTARTIAP